MVLSTSTMHAVLHMQYLVYLQHTAKFILTCDTAGGKRDESLNLLEEGRFEDVEVSLIVKFVLILFSALHI